MDVKILFPAQFNRKYCFVDNTIVNTIFCGLSNDLETLRREFLASNNYSFSSYADIWKKVQFASIFGERYRAKEVFEYVQGVLHYLKGYVFAQDLLSSVFGIYTMYSVYYKQTVRNKPMKIRLTLQEFRDIKSRMAELTDSGYQDPVYIFHHLHQDGAIQYVIMSLEPGMERNTRKYFGKTEEDSQTEISQSSTPFDLSLLESFEDAFQIYTKNKEIAFSNCNAFSSSSTFLESIKKKLHHFGTDECHDEDVNEAQGNKSVDIGEKRRGLKAKSFTARVVAGGSAQETTEAKNVRTPGRRRRFADADICFDIKEEQ